MYNLKPLSTFRGLEGVSSSVLPNYIDYGFAQVMPTINYLLAGVRQGNILPSDCFKNNTYPQVKNLVLFFIDAYGWLFFDPKKGKVLPSLLDRHKEEIMVTPITSTFPSSTPAAVNSLSYGSNITCHGIFDVRMYVPQIDEYIWTFNFEPVVGDKKLFKERGLNISQMYLEQHTNWEYLASNGVASHHFAPKKLIKTDFNKNSFRGSSQYGYITLSEGLYILKNSLNETQGKNLFYFYIEDIDVLMHKYGPDSQEVNSEIELMWQAIENIFGDYDKPNDTVFMFTADHGQVEGDLDDVFWFNEEIEGFDEYLRINSKGEKILPVGGSRASFLLVKPDKIIELYIILTKRLKGVAKVMLTEELIQSGLLPNEDLSVEFIERLGDIQVLPVDKKLVWYKQDGVTKKKPGAHGGLHPDEMLTQVVVW